MLPSILSREIKTGIRRFLQSTFPCSTPLFSASLEQLFTEKEGMFKGPYYSMRLPFCPDESTREYFGAIRYPYRPHKHQALAFARLTGKEPASTLVATGTGSGKTECFLYPILDYCVRNSARKGIKAIVIYPMNALATDQAKRFAKAVHAEAAARGKVRVGMYIGGEGEPHQQMGEQNVITDRATMRSNPPDILLTNYKMLDYLLIRPNDLNLWQHNEPDTLKFIVVDELHTFDGAQATDLGCLLRRLGARLKTDPGYICHIGTSATIGSAEQEQELLGYAGQLFGCRLEGSKAIIREHLVTQEAFTRNFYIKYAGMPGREEADALRPAHYASISSYLRAQYTLWFNRAAPDDVFDNAWRVRLGEELRQHSVFRNLLMFFDRRALDRGSRHVSEAELLQELALFSEDLQNTELAYQVFDSLCSLSSHARYQHTATGAVFPLLKIHVHLWFRELSRMVATVEAGAGSAPQLRFSADLKDADLQRCLPVIHCRDCGSMGWGALQRANDQHLSGGLDKFYQGFFSKDPKLRFVYPADPHSGEEFVQTLCGHCLHLTMGAVDGCPACGHSERLVPVQVHQQTVRAGDYLKSDKSCPHCQSESGVTILGSRSASLSSVALGQAYATRFNDDKQALAFSDNVQDASHRAAFFAARTYRMTLRTAMAAVLREQQQEQTLEQVEKLFVHTWQTMLSPESFVGTFLAPNMTWIEDFETLRREGTLPQDSRLPEDVAMRLRWEVVSEFGFQATVGRTLEKSGVAVPALDPVKLAQASADLHTGLVEKAGGFGSLGVEPLRICLLGLLHRLRTLGGIYHEPFMPYFRNFKALYALNRQKWGPGYYSGGRLPAAFCMGTGNSGKMERLLATGNSLSWAEKWAIKCLTVPGGLSKEAAGIVLDQAVATLCKNNLLVEDLAENQNRLWLLPKSALVLSNAPVTLRCDCCGNTQIMAEKEWLSCHSPLPCSRHHCQGHYAAATQGTDYFGELYQSGDVLRIHSEEHTGLIPRKEREWIEKRFMATTDKRSTDPNLLSCTPTLEMGIDIGDLSTVLLCSVPPSTANYVQRVGRAGRRDGNAFALTVANAQSHDLYFYRQPQEMMEGSIQVPGVFFNAPAVLERQFIAFCFDNWIAHSSPTPRIPDTISVALNNVLKPADPPSGFPYDLLGYIQRNRTQLIDDFFGLFGTMINEDARDALRAFAIGNRHTQESLESKIVKRMRIQANELEDVRKRRMEIKKRLKALTSVQAKDEALQTEIDLLEQTAKGLGGIIKTIRETNTLNFFTDEGLLPNYAFPEEGVTLRSIILRKKERKQSDKEGNYFSETLEYQRPAASAIKELAPGSHFYAQHRRLTVDQVNLRLSEPEMWNFCDQCAHIERLDTSLPVKSACPICGSGGWADNSMRRKMIPMRQVVTTEWDREARTYDDSDERSPEFFDSQTSVSIPNDEVKKAYQVKHATVPFGYEFVRQATLRTINLGAVDSSAETSMLGGRERPARGFKLCPACGKVKGARDNKGTLRHDILCPNRDNSADEESLEAYFLYRELSSEALRILVPSVGGSESTELSSFVAALQIGLEKYFKGNIDHLGSCTETRPLPHSSFKRTYLVIYDKVPGGTGYLKELSRESVQFIRVLELALQHLKECSCQNEVHLDGCHRCVRKNVRKQSSHSEPSRALGIKILEQILGHGDEIEEITSIAAIDVNPLIESQLEQRFVECLSSVSGMLLKSELIAGKNGYLLSCGEQRWEIMPQVEIKELPNTTHTTRPDFVISPLRKSDSLPIAVYLDGFAFHADEEAGNNRVAHDLLLREGLRRTGKWLVWSLTWEDLNPKFTLNPNDVPGREKEARARRAQLLTGISPDLAKAMHAREDWNSWQWLVQFLKDPDTATCQRYAYCYALSLKQAEKVAREAAIACCDALLHPYGEDPPQLKFTEANHGIGFLHSAKENRWNLLLYTDLSSVKDRDHKRLHGLWRFDDANALFKESFMPAWQGLLVLHNLLQFLPGVLFATLRMLQSSLDTQLYDLVFERTPAPTVPTTTYPIDLDLVHPDVVELLLKIFDQHIPLPQCAYELTAVDGSVTAEAELAWPEHKLVLLTREQELCSHLFANKGWRVHLLTAADTDTIFLNLKRTLS